MANPVSIVAYVLRSGPEERFDSLVGELAFTTDTLKLLLRAGRVDPIQVPTSGTTGTFRYDPNLVFSSLNITESKIDKTAIGQVTPEQARFTDVLIENSDVRAFRMRSTGLSHGHSVFDNTANYLEISMASQTNGGTVLKSGSKTGRALQIEGVVPIDEVALANSNGPGIIENIAATTSNGDLTNLTETQIAYSVSARQSDGSLRRLLQLSASGDLYLSGDTNQITFDSFNDIRILNGLRGMVSSVDTIKEQFSEDIEYSKEALTQHGVVNLNDDGSISKINYKKAFFVLVDAVRQIGDKLDEHIKSLG